MKVVFTIFWWIYFNELQCVVRIGPLLEAFEDISKFASKVKF